MVYDNSIEEQKYLSSIRKEKNAFERLIREKAVCIQIFISCFFIVYLLFFL